jgi:hypothetical protein
LDRLSWSETLAGDSSRTKVPKPAGVQQKVWQYSNSSVSKSIKAVCREQTLREIRPILTSACLEYSSPHWYFSCQILDNLQHCQNHMDGLCLGGSKIDAHRRTSTYAHMYIHVHTKHIRMHTIFLGWVFFASLVGGVNSSQEYHITWNHPIFRMENKEQLNPDSVKQMMFNKTTRGFWYGMYSW